MSQRQIRAKSWRARRRRKSDNRNDGSERLSAFHHRWTRKAIKSLKANRSCGFSNTSQLPEESRKSLWLLPTPLIILSWSRTNTKYLSQNLAKLREGHKLAANDCLISSKLIRQKTWKALLSKDYLHYWGYPECKSRMFLSKLWTNALFLSTWILSLNCAKMIIVPCYTPTTERWKEDDYKIYNILQDLISRVPQHRFLTFWGYECTSRDRQSCPKWHCWHVWSWFMHQ